MDSSSRSPTSPLDDTAISNTDASQYLIKDLKQLQGSSIFDKLDFSKCPDMYLEKLFVAKADSYLPPTPYRCSSSQITDWINMTVAAQEQAFVEMKIQPTARFKRPARRVLCSKKLEDEESASLNGDAGEFQGIKEKRKIVRKKDKIDKSSDTEQPARKKARKPPKKLSIPSTDHEQQSNALTGNELANQEKANDLLRSEQYSAIGSIIYSDDEVENEVGDDADDVQMYRGRPVALDHKSLLQAARVYMNTDKRVIDLNSDEDANDATQPRSVASSNQKPIRTARTSTTPRGLGSHNNRLSIDSLNEEEELYNGASIFGQTQGQNATWVECDKCKKWRRLRGKVDASKLPTRWFCSMNKTDAARAKCSAPEEAYDEGQSVTPESAADARARKHFRVWSRRIKTQEAYEAGQPPMTRGKKKQVAGSKDPYEWVRCCNPSCGKWRSLLRVMGAKSHVIDRTANGEWYCVMNPWDEKMASCGAPQENLPTFGCPPWVQQDP
ncbi:hypothetical protein MPSEU_000259100 [Mayamaea pseudoterrestris]|nr:hypothetical protein MPSEU_000259100 [Mayamaea pseudoterrestris]